MKMFRLFNKVLLMHYLMPSTEIRKVFDGDTIYLYIDRLAPGEQFNSSYYNVQRVR